MLVQFLALFLFAFLCGSIPFSVWLGRLVGRDVRRFGDGNPGAVNALRAGRWPLGLAVLLLDVLKGVLPAHLAYGIYQVRGWPMVLIALAPILGHAFSPFLRFRGGKSLATTLGVWIGLAFWQAPAVLVTAVLAWYGLLGSTAWAVILALSTLMAYFIAFDPNPVYLGVLAGQLLLLGWKQRDGLALPPRLRLVRPRG